MDHPHLDAGRPGHSSSSGEEVEKLVRWAAEGDQLAWDRLVEQFSGLLWSVCRAHRLSPADAADAFQQTWLRLLENLDSIRDPQRLAAWLGTTCRRECLSVLRRARRSVPTDNDQWLDHLDGVTPGADRAILTSDRNAGLWQAFGRLNQRCQQILRVLVMTGDRPSYELAAASLDMPVGSLGPTRARCLARLRILLDTEGISSSATDS